MVQVIGRIEIIVEIPRLAVPDVAEMVLLELTVLLLSKKDSALLAYRFLTYSSRSGILDFPELV